MGGEVEKDGEGIEGISLPFINVVADMLMLYRTTEDPDISSATQN